MKKIKQEAVKPLLKLAWFSLLEHDYFWNVVRRGIRFKFLERGGSNYRVPGFGEGALEIPLSISALYQNNHSFFLLFFYIHSFLIPLPFLLCSCCSALFPFLFVCFSSSPFHLCLLIPIHSHSPHSSFPPSLPSPCLPPLP